MSQRIKAIETRYKGYRFRSRLEARWAVFFDAIGVRWEYEREGFDLGDTGYYLPDFYLSGVGFWVEVKPFDHEADYNRKAIAFARKFGQPMLLIVGNPWPAEHWVEVMILKDNPDEPSKPEFEHECAAYIGKCRCCPGICLVYDTEVQRHSTMDGYSEIGKHTCGSHEKWPLMPDDAFAAARGARFEHGETPKVGGDSP